MSAKKPSYQKLKGLYQSLFDRADAHVEAHPDTELEFDEMGEEDPALGFKHREGEIWVHTVFVLKR